MNSKNRWVCSMVDRRVLHVLLLIGILPLLGAGTIPHTVDATRTESGVSIQDITYMSGELRIKAILFDGGAAGPRPGIVFNHGGVSGISKDMVRRSIDLARAGYIVLTPAYRGEGGSDGVIEVAAGEVDDVLAAAELLRHHARVDRRRIALVGSSHGALISVLAAARDHRFQAVAAACGVMNADAWYRYLVANGFDVSDSLSVAVYGRGPDDRPEAFRVRRADLVAGKLRSPLLFQQGEKDRIVPVDQVWRMKAALDRAGHRFYEVRTYPLLGHAFWFWDDLRYHTREEIDEADASWRDLTAFLDRHLEPGAREHSDGTTTMPENPSRADEDRGDQEFARDHRAWHDKRVERLKADNGWLSVAGLFWLRTGENRFGTAEDNDIVLPAGSAPAHAGRFVVTGDRVVFTPEPGAGIVVDGAPAEEMELRSDMDGDPQVLELGDLRMFLIQRTKGPAIRLRDLNAPARRAFSGIECYPPDPAWRVEARFVPYDPPKPVEIADVTGGVDTMMAPGYAEFAVDGRTVRLEPVVSSMDYEDLFFIFRDATSGTETYPPGRFLYTGLPVDGRLTIDFNRAYNPPCAFTDYATCPLPPPENTLPVAIRAGEKDYRHH